LVHSPYNEVGIDLQAAVSDKIGEWRWSIAEPSTLLFARTPSPFRTSPTTLVASDLTTTNAVPGLSHWLSLIGVVIGVYVLGRSVTRRIFVLDLYPGVRVEPARSPVGLAGNVLLLGPPGSGKTTTLAKVGIPIFDVRTLCAVAPVIAVASPNSSSPNPPTPARQQRQMAGASADWVDLFDYSALPETVAIDHFEHRLDEPTFRDQMLRFLEELVYRRQRNVCIASSVDPFDRFQQSSGTLGDMLGPGAAELDRWTQLFASFRTEYINVGDSESFADTIAALAKNATPSLIKIIV